MNGEVPQITRLDKFQRSKYFKFCEQAEILAKATV